MIDYNNEFNHRMATATGFDNPDPPAGDDYAEWADHLGQLAEAITQPALSDHAHRAADLAHQASAIASRSLAESPPSPGKQPDWVADYARIDQSFRDELEALDTACPT